MNSKVVIPAVLVRCSFAPVRPRVPRVRTRGDLRTVMTSETVPVEQPGTVVDELRDQRSNGGDAVCRTRAVRVRSF